MRIGIVLPDQKDIYAGGLMTFCRQYIAQTIQIKNSKDTYVFFCQHHFYDECFQKCTNQENIEFVHLHFFNLRIAVCARFHSVFNFILERWNFPKHPLNRIFRKYKIDYAIYTTFSPLTSDIPYTYIALDTNWRDFPALPVSSNFNFRERMFREALPRAFRIVIGAEEGKKRLGIFFNVHPEVVRIIPLPVIDMQKLSGIAPEQLPDVVSKYKIKQKFIFYPAQLRDGKNHITLLKAMKYLKEEKNSDLTLILTGAKIQDELFKYYESVIEKFDLKDTVRFTGFVSDAEIAAFYRKAAAMVFCSCTGPDNLPPLEAMHLKCPVICARYAGAEDQLGDAALFFDIFDYKQLAEHILRIRADDSLRKTLIERGTKLAAERNFNYAERVLETAEEYRQFASMFREI